MYFNEIDISDYWHKIRKHPRALVRLTSHLEIIDLFLEHETLNKIQANKLTKNGLYAGAVLRNLEQFGVVTAISKAEVYRNRELSSVLVYKLNKNVAVKYVDFLMTLRDKLNA